MDVFSDVNTRFSGVHLGELDSAMMDLVAVRAAACAFIGPDTIIVGHGYVSVFLIVHPIEEEGKIAGCSILEYQWKEGRHKG